MNSSAQYAILSVVQHVIASTAFCCSSMMVLFPLLCQGFAFCSFDEHSLTHRCSAVCGTRPWRSSLYGYFQPFHLMHWKPVIIWYCIRHHHRLTQFGRIHTYTFALKHLNTSHYPNLWTCHRNTHFLAKERRCEYKSSLFTTTGIHTRRQRVTVFMRHTC